MNDEQRQIRVEITPEKAVELLRRLATEDEFRSRFEKDTRGLLREYAIEVPADLMPADVQAPPQGMLLEALAALGQDVRAEAPFTPLAAEKVPFGPAPFAPFSFAYYFVFIALHRAEQS